MALLTLFLTHAPEKQEIPSVFTVRMFFPCTFCFAWTFLCCKNKLTI